MNNIIMDYSPTKLSDEPGIFIGSEVSGLKEHPKISKVETFGCKMSKST